MMSNRPIKLRAWDTDSRTFVPVVSLQLLESRPVVQFTGVYDANGSEIWEGDILCWRHVDEVDRIYYKCFSRVVFRNGAFSTIGADESDDLDHFENINSGDTLAGKVFVDKDLLTCNLD